MGEVRETYEETIIESTGNYSFKYNKMTVASAIVQSTQDAGKSVDITQKIEALIVGNTLNIDSAKLNDYVGYDIDHYVVKKLILVIDYISETPPYTNLAQFPVGKTDNLTYNADLHNLDLYIPSHPTQGLDVVLYVHGGYFLYGDEEDDDAINTMARLNSDGYIAASMTYSLQPNPTDGFTQEWWINSVVEATNDLIDAIHYIKGLGATGVHIMGYSAGAVMVLMTALGNNHPFTSMLKQIPTDFILTRTSIGGSLTTPEGFSIVDYLDTNGPQLLLWNGTADTTVDPAGAIAIKQQYIDLGQSEKCRFYLLEGASHTSILFDPYNGKTILDVWGLFVESLEFYDIEQQNGEIHSRTWRAEEGIKIAQLKRNNLLGLKSDLYRIESDIVLCKIKIELLKSEIETYANKISNIQAKHGLAHTFENIMNAVSDFKIFEDAVLIQELLDKSLRLVDEAHSSHRTTIVDSYAKRLEQLQLEMDMKRMLSEVGSLRVLIIDAEKEVEDDTIGERETLYTKIETELAELHYGHQSFAYEEVYEHLLKNQQEMIMDLIQYYANPPDTN